MTAMLPGPLRFAVWFTCQDLMERAARPVTLVVIMSIALTTVGSVVGLAFPSVMEHIRLRRLADDPLSRCLWVSDHPLGRKFTPSLLAELNRSVLNRLPPGSEISVHGFHELDLEFFLANGTTQWARGRTLRADDPLAAAVSRLLRSESNPAGIVVSPRILAELHMPEDESSPSWSVRSPRSGRSVEVPGRGVTKTPLPLAHRFWLPENEDERLRANDAGEPQALIRSGPLGGNWPRSLTAYPESVRDLLDDWRVRVSVDRVKGQEVWKLLSESAVDEETWRDRLEQIADQVAPTYGAAPGFAVVEASLGGRRAPPSRGDYTRAAVLVPRLADLRLAADGVTALRLRVDESALPQIEQIEATAALARLIFSLLVSLFGIAATVGLALSLYLRGRQKAAQVGMLLALGTSRRGLLFLNLVESAVLWFLGTTLGLALVLMGTVMVLPAVGLTVEELWDATTSGGWMLIVFVFLGFSLLATAGGNAFATRDLRRGSPARGLGLAS